MGLIAAFAARRTRDGGARSPPAKAAAGTCLVPRAAGCDDLCRPDRCLRQPGERGRARRARRRPSPRVNASGRPGCGRPGANLRGPAAFLRRPGTREGASRPPGANRRAGNASIAGVGVRYAPRPSAARLPKRGKSCQREFLFRARRGVGLCRRTPECSGGARQGAVSVGGAKVGIASAGIGATGRKAPPVSAGAAAGGSAEKLVRRRGALCAEPVGGPNALSARRRTGD